MKNKFLVSLLLGSALILTGCGESHTYPPKDFNTLSLTQKIKVSQNFIGEMSQVKSMSDIQKEDKKTAQNNLDKFRKEHIKMLLKQLGN